MQCKKCGSEMKVRDGSYGKFWGCSTFPDCRGTLPYSDTDQRTGFGQKAKVEVKKIENPTEEQQEALRALGELIKAGKFQYKDNFVINATAGGGKTALLKHMIHMLREQKPFVNVIYLTFDKQSQLEAQAEGLPARTINSKLFQDYRNWLTKKQQKENVEVKLNVDKNKVYGILRNLLKAWFDTRESRDEVYYLVAPCKKVVDHLKIYGHAEAYEEQVADIIMSSGLPVMPKHIVLASELVVEALRINNTMLDTIDFSDQVYFPYIFNIPIQTYEFVFVDEMQDLSQVMGTMVLRMLAENSKMIGCGDSDQSIYAFRGASVDSIPRLVELTNSAVLPLTITFRCPQEAGRLINEVHPHIAFNIFEKNEVGEIREMHEDNYLDHLQDGDTVICRVNAPLIKPVYDLLKRGIKAYVLGRSIGRELTAMLTPYEYDTNSDTTSVDYLLKSIWKDFSERIIKLKEEKRELSASNLLDKYQTLKVLTEGCETSGDVKRNINRIFSDDKKGICFTTIHKYKGNETDNVFLLRSELNPHPLAKTEEEMAQEINMDFVRLSRFKKTLTYVVNKDPLSRCPVLTTVDYERAMLEKQETEEDAEEWVIEGEKEACTQEDY